MISTVIVTSSWRDSDMADVTVPTLSSKQKLLRKK